MINEQPNQWKVTNQPHMRALKVVLVISVLMMISAIAYAFLGIDQPLAIFLAITSLLIIVQFALLKPAFISVVSNGSQLLIHSRSLFNPISKLDIQINIHDISDFQLVKGKRVIGGRLLINYKVEDESSSVTIFLVNFTIGRRNKLVQHLSETIK